MPKFWILIVMVIYVITAIQCFTKGNNGLGIAFAGYAFSNIGLFMLA